MTTPAEMLRKYETKPFSLWELRGKQFVILENLPIDVKSHISFREKKEHNEKYNKDQTCYYILIEEGLFHKDIRLTETELFLLMAKSPKGLMNYQGAIFEVDQKNKYAIEYKGTAQQDINGNQIGNNANRGQNTPISQGHPPQDQKELFIRQLIEAINYNARMKIPVDEAMLLKIADNITNGKGADLVS